MEGGDCLDESLVTVSLQRVMWILAALGWKLKVAEVDGKDLVLTVRKPLLSANGEVVEDG